MAKNDPYAIGYTPTSDDQLAKDVNESVAAAIAAEVAPLQQMLGQTERTRDTALTDIGNLFGTLQPAVQQSADAVRTSYDQALAGEKSVFNEAAARLNDLRQSTAQRAQALAQQIGAPVSLESMFTSGIAQEQGLQGLEAAGGLLHGIGLGQAGVEEAQAFSGKVFPLMRAEEENRTRSQFDNQIKEIQAEITRIRQTKGARVDEELTKRRLQEREFALQRAQANRDFYLARQSLKTERERLALQRQELYGESPTGKPTLEAKKMNKEQKLQKQEFLNARKQNAMDLLEAYTNPGAQKVTQTQMVPVEGPDSPGAFWNGSQWVRYENVTQMVKSPTYSHPGEVYEKIMTRLGVDERGNPGFAKWLQQMVGNATGNTGWVYGQAPEAGRRSGSPPPRRDFKTYTHQQLLGMSPAQLIKHLRGTLGFKQPLPEGIKNLQKPMSNEALAKLRGKKVKAQKDNKKYNESLKNWAIYWIQRIQNMDTGARLGEYPH